MAVSVRCPNPQCSVTASVAEEHLGRTLRCPKCGQSFVAPRTMDQQPEPALAPTMDAPPASGAASLNSAPLHPQAPSKIARFVVRSQLGAGAFGTVYRAHDPELDREVALKVPQPGIMNNPTAVQRFLHEGRAAARLRHPHILAVYEAGNDGGLPYLATEFVQGHTLADALSKRPLDFRRAAQVTIDLAEALAYAHAQGIVHRDVKPANVMLDAQGQVKLMDFGLAHRDDASKQLTQAGSVLGTPAYMSPEQAAGDTAAVGPASDQYGLGMILYEMITGRLPFEGPVHAVLYQAVHEPPAPPRSFRSDVPTELERICLKALAKKREERFRDCQELADTLRQWLASPAPSAIPAASAVRRKSPFVLTGASLFVAGLVTAIVIASLPSDNDSGEPRDPAKERKDDVAQNTDRPGNDKPATDQNKPPANPPRLVVEAHVDLEGHAADVSAFCFSPDGKHLITGSKDGTAKLWTVPEGGLVSTFSVVKEEPKAVNCVGFSPDGEWLAFGGEDRVVCLYKVSDGTAGPRLEEHEKPVVQLIFGRDGQIITASEEGKLRDWSVKDGKLLRSHDLPGGSFLLGARVLALSRDGKLLAVADDCLSLWRQPAGGRVPIEDYEAIRDISQLALDPEGRFVLHTIYPKPEVTLLPLPTGKPPVLLKGHEKPIIRIALSPDGKIAATCSQDGTARLWATPEGTALATLKGHDKNVWQAAFSHDGKLLATYGVDHTVRIWSVPAGKQVAMIEKQENLLASECSSIAFSPTGKWLATIPSTGVVRLWSYRTATGKD